MRNAKRFLSLAVAALLSVSAVATSASAAKFSDVDVKNEALNDAVELLTALNVTKGTSDTEFGTAQNVTREQMAAFIYRMMKAGKSVEGGVNNTSFTDLDDPTFYFMVSWANSQGIIKGRSATTFDPKGGITLQDAYTMIVRALGYDDGTYAYPISYISKAEDLGLDEDLPSTLNYTDTLTRGDVAIILANMFYAETAEVEIKYEAGWTEVYSEKTGEYHVVSTGQVPKEYQKTVAEAVFEVEKISQRVVATPNYSFGGYEKPDEDVEMLFLSSEEVIDYDDYDTNIKSLNQVEFAELGLEGSADDYFLSDIVMFVKEVDGEYEIFGAAAQGTKTTVSFDDIEFGRVSGTDAKKYYDGAEKEYKIINGKLTLGDTVTYLFDAPYSFAKDQETNKYNAKFITLADFDGDMEEGKVYMNYELDTNAPGVDKDTTEEIVGTYADGAWTYNGYLSQMFFGGLGEVDVYDCDGDGRPDYLFVKNYTVGTVDTEEDAMLLDSGIDMDVVADEVVIYTDMSIVEGVEFADDDVVLAYINEDANYVKVAEVLTGVESAISTSASKYFALESGEKVYYQDAKAVVSNGAYTLSAVNADSQVDFDNEATYYFAANGKLVSVTGLATAISLNENYVVVLEDTAYLSTAMVDGKLEKAYYIDIYNDGEVKSVKAKTVAVGSSVYDEKETPAVDPSADGAYSAYVNKLATGKSDKKGAYYFELVDFTINTSMTDEAGIQSKEESGEYRAQVNGTTEFAQKSGYLYTLEDATDATNSKVKGVYVKDYTHIIIRSLDKDGEEIVTLYGYDNLPSIKEGTQFADVSYVLVNNVNSTSYENLAVFYGVAVAKNAEGKYEIAEMEPYKGEVADVRVIKSYTTTSTEDGTVKTYDVFNPFDGKTVPGIEGAETDSDAGFTVGSIVGLTTEGYIDDSVAAAGNAYTAGTYYDVDEDFDNYGTNMTKGALGWMAVAEYDESTGYLEVGTRETSKNGKGETVYSVAVADNAPMFQITDETVVTFSDKSDATITTVDASILASTSKSYRQGEIKAEPLRVFLCVEEDEDNDDETLYIVKFAMIVRD